MAGQNEKNNKRIIFESKNEILMFNRNQPMAE
jgi:hypothetical protein